VLKSLKPPPHGVTQHVSNVMDLIGRFDLDPNRVLDVVLDLYEQQLWNSSYVELMRRLAGKNLVHVLGHKFSFYATYVDKVAQDSKLGTDKDAGKSKLGGGALGGGTESGPAGVSAPSEAAVALRAPTRTPSSLFDMTAQLLVHGLVTMEDVGGYMSPTLAEMRDRARDDERAHRKQIRSFGVTSLLGRSAGLEGGADAGSAVAASAAEGAASGAGEGPIDDTEVTTLLPMTTPKPGPKIDSAAAGSPSTGEDDQMIGLFVALLKLRRWDVAHQLYAALVAAKVDVLARPAASAAMADYVSWVIAPVYASIGAAKSGLGGSNGSTTAAAGAGKCVIAPRALKLNRTSALTTGDDAGAGAERTGQARLSSLTSFPEDVYQLLVVLGPRCGVSARLFTQLCRLLRAVLISPDADSCAAARRRRVAPILTEIMFPALTLSEAGVFLPSQLWAVVADFPFYERFALYDAWKGAGLAKDGMGSKPHCVVMAETAQLKAAKNVLKRLSKDNIKLSGKALGRTTHTNPLAAYDFILTSIGSYANLIPYIVEALRFSTDLSRDCMAWSILQQLQASGSRLRSGDTNYSPWFAGLTKFIGVFYRKFYAVELKGLLHFLMDRLANGESLDLLILKELLARMGGCDLVTELSADQLEAMSGGALLRLETVGSTGDAEMPRPWAVKSLRETMHRSGMAMPLVRVIAQLQETIAQQESHVRHGLKLVSHLIDTCHATLIQFTDFLSAGGTSEALKDLDAALPPLAVLLGDYKLPVPIVFQLTRPLMRAALKVPVDLTLARRTRRARVGPSPAAAPVYRVLSNHATVLPIFTTPSLPASCDISMNHTNQTTNRLAMTRTSALIRCGDGTPFRSRWWGRCATTYQHRCGPCAPPSSSFCIGFLRRMTLPRRTRVTQLPKFV
jgi:THO complex subunit 2